MKSIGDQVDSYAAYHQDPRNQATHFVGVPLVIFFSLFLFLSWFRFVDSVIPLTAAALCCTGVFAYYVLLDRKVGLLEAPFSLAILYLADRAAQLDFTVSLSLFAAAFIAGWVIQLLGDHLAGKRPALANNFLQIFNAPLYLTVEWQEMRKKRVKQTCKSLEGG